MPESRYVLFSKSVFIGYRTGMPVALKKVITGTEGLLVE